MTSPAPSCPDATHRSGGRLLIDQLVAFGATHAFMVPGESFLPCIDALYDRSDRIRTVVCRQEGGAAYMAEAHAKLTGQPGIAFVSRGPGASNAVIGVETAQHDSTPMILFIGQIGSTESERDSFQEVDYTRLFAPLCKWAAQIEDADRIPEYLSRAYTIAMSGRRGPVVLSLPEDMLSRLTAASTVPTPALSAGGPTPMQLDTLKQWIAQARHPLLLLGGNGWSEDARTAMHRFAERFGLAVATAWRRLELFDSDHPHYIGQVSASMPDYQKALVARSDLVIAVGTRLCEPTTMNYRWLASPVPTQRLVHVHPDPVEIGKVIQPSLAIAADVNTFSLACDALHPSDAPTRVSLPPTPDMPAMAGPLDLNACMRQMRDMVTGPVCITVGAGNYALYAHRHLPFKGLGAQLSPALGAMGYGLPAAIAAKLHDPARTVVCFAGDGCFQMTMQEFGTAVQQRLGIIVLVFNNNLYGTIRLHQERAYPGRAIGTALENPDFACLARSYGAFGRAVLQTSDFTDAFRQAQAFAHDNSLPALIELRYSPDQILPDKTLAQATA